MKLVTLTFTALSTILGVTGIASAQGIDVESFNKVDKIRDDGTVVYREVCHAAGTAWGDKAPKPFTVPASCRAGLAKGRTVRVNDGPAQVFTDKSEKHLVALACLALE